MFDICIETIYMYFSSKRSFFSGTISKGGHYFLTGHFRLILVQVYSMSDFES